MTRGGVRLAVDVDCITAAGSVFTVLSGAAVNGQLDTLRGAPIKDGGTVPVASSLHCSGQIAGAMTVHYTRTSVTLTYAGTKQAHADRG